MRAVQKKGQGYRSDIVRNSNEVAANKTSGSDSTSYTIDRLHREAPELYEQVHPEKSSRQIGGLIRVELGPSDRSGHIARRKEIYEALYPETKHGANAADAAATRWSDASGNDCHSHPTGQTKRFTKATAEATGRSERSIRGASRRGSKVAPDVLERVKGTKFDRVNYLDGMARLSHERQRKTALRVDIYR